MEGSGDSSLVLVLSIIFSVLIMGGMFYFMRRKMSARPITYVEHFIRDQSGRHLHIFGAQRIMPDEGESFDIWHHRIFDLTKLTFFPGDSLRGEKLELDSPFVIQSLQKLSAAVGFNLALGEDSGRIDDQDDPEDNDQFSLRAARLPLFYRDHLPTSTERPRTFPADSIIVTQVSEEPERFSIVLRKNGADAATHIVPGDPDYFGRVIWLDPEPWVAITYRRVLPLRSAMALLVLNHQTGEMVFNNFIIASSGKPNSAVQK